MADGPPRPMGVASGWFVASSFFFFFWGSGRGTEGGLLTFFTKHQNYRPLKNFRRGRQFGNSIFREAAALDMLYSLSVVHMLLP